jgi:hypothetical protein
MVVVGSTVWASVLTSDFVDRPTGEELSVEGGMCVAVVGASMVFMAVSEVKVSV